MTFVLGVLTGMFLYVTGFAPAYETGELANTEETYLEIRSEMYDDICEEAGAGCPRYVLTENRKLVRVYTEADVEQMRIASDEWQRLQAILEDNTLERYAASGCETTEAGYRYQVIYKGDTYHMDSCNRVFRESALFAFLDRLWGSDIQTTSVPFQTLEEGLHQSVQEYLQDQFPSVHTQ